MQSFFQNSAGSGFADRFKSDLTVLTDSNNGVLNSDLAENSTEQSNLTDQISNFQTRLLAQQAQLEQEFNQVNATLEAYPYLLAQITASLDTTSIVSNSSNSSSKTG